MKRIIAEYSEESYANKLDKLDEMDKFLKTQNLPIENYRLISHEH